MATAGRHSHGVQKMKYKNLKVGDMVLLQGERFSYKVICRDERFIICTKPFNLHQTVLYFIIDLEKKIYGPDNSIFCAGYETLAQCQERLQELQNGTLEVSLRHCVPLE